MTYSVRRVKRSVMADSEVKMNAKTSPNEEVCCRQLRIPLFTDLYSIFTTICWQLRRTALLLLTMESENVG